MLKNAFKNDPFGILEKAFAELWPEKEYIALREPSIRPEENGQPVHGLTDFGEDGSVVVFVSSDLRMIDAIEIFAHELAHVAAGYEHDHDDEWEKAFVALFEKYNEIGDKLFLEVE